MAIRILSGATDGVWEEPSEESGGSSLLADAFSGVMTADHLSVLAGLGTSLCVKDASNGMHAPTMADLWQHVKEETGGAFDAAAEAVGYPLDTEQDIEALLSKCQSLLDVRADDAVATFVQDAEKAIAARCNFLTDASSLSVHQAFLTRLARRPQQKDRLRLFTTNYDLAFELAAAEAGFIVVDGFAYTFPHKFSSSQYDYDIVRRVGSADSVEFLPNVFHLYKLHGSVDWELDGSSAVKRPGTDRPLLIYPRASKFQLSYRLPFFDMLAAFQEQLRKSNVGVVITGFGFRDLHIVQPVLGAVRANHSLSLLVIDPCLEEDPPEAIQQLMGLVKAGDPRVTLVAATFEEIAPVIPLLHPETYSEIHSRRVAAIEFP